MSKNKIVVALFGQSGAGKDTILKEFLKKYPNFHKIVSHTTRPKRDAEKNDENYHFVTLNDFGTMVLNNKMLEAAEFNGWFYGTHIDSLREDKINIGTFDVERTENLLNEPGITVIPIYVYANDKTRLMRSLNREKNPDIDEIFRRYKAEKAVYDFIDFKHDTLINDGGKLECIIEDLENIIMDNLLKL